MKVPNFAVCLLFISELAVLGAAQGSPADSNPVILGSATYTMPQSAIDADIGGTVVIAIRIDESGKPTKAVLASGPMWPCGGKTPTRALDELASSLADVAMKLKFSPAIKDGNPVERDIGLTIQLKNPNLETPAVDIGPVHAKPKATLVNGGVLNGKAIQLPKPAYPVEARRNRDSGTVNVLVYIDEEGKILRAGAVSGAPTLQWAAREAACGAKFSPTTLVGSPVKVSGVITYNFVP